MVVKSEMDIIRTIDDEEEVENLSEDSEAEVEVNLAKILNQNKNF